MPWQLAGAWPGLTGAHGWGILQFFYHFCALANKLQLLSKFLTLATDQEHIHWLEHTQISFKDMLFKALLPFDPWD